MVGGVYLLGAAEGEGGVVGKIVVLGVLGRGGFEVAAGVVGFALHFGDYAVDVVLHHPLVAV